MKLLDCPLFNGISENEIENLLKCLKAKEQKFSRFEEICSYNNKKGILGIVLLGKVYIKKLDRDGNYSILEQVLKHGVFCDDFAYTPTDANYISVFAEENSTILLINYEEVFKRCASACSFHSTFVKNLMKIVIDKTKTLSQRVEILSNKTIKDKILGYCSLMLSQNPNSKTFTLPMSYTSLAEYLCVDRSALMREVKKLNDARIIKTDKKTITILSDEYI